MKPSSFDTFLTPSKLALHKESHTTTKLKPKIRIIHIVAPEIIKTDVENFRELVQRLTGKPAREVKSSIKKESHEVKESIKKEKVEYSAGVPLWQDTPKIMEENYHDQDLNGENSNGFFSFLADLDDFLNNQDTNELVTPRFRSSEISVFGEINLW